MQETYFSGHHEDIQATICRAELYLKHVNMTKDVLQSLTAVLFNHIDKKDSQSMKRKSGCCPVFPTIYIRLLRLLHGSLQFTCQ
jgi:hypothetical protein